ncbi:ATP-binding protein [Patescibacteria group bacterium]|nr:ATP-binding protein [Patescibacteria group bacterium]
MKLALTGAQSTGKTTLAKELSKLFNLPLITEQSRTVIKQFNVTAPKYLKEEELPDFQWKLFASQIIEEQSKKNFISDRCPTCFAAYASQFCKDETFIKEYAQKIENYLLLVKPYDLIIYVPPMFPIEDDGIRSSSEEVQHKTDLLIQHFLEMWKTKYGLNIMTINKASFQGRIKQVENYIEDPLRLGI